MSKFLVGQRGRYKFSGTNGYAWGGEEGVITKIKDGLIYVFFERAGAAHKPGRTIVFFDNGTGTGRVRDPNDSNSRYLWMTDGRKRPEDVDDCTDQGSSFEPTAKPSDENLAKLLRAAYAQYMGIQKELTGRGWNVVPDVDGDVIIFKKETL